MKIGYLRFLLSLVLVLNLSCSDEIDTDQLDNLAIEPTVAGSVVYVRTTEELILAATGDEFYTQEFDFDGFSTPFFAEKVLSGQLNYELENTTNQPLRVTVQFLNEDREVVDFQVLTIGPAPTNALLEEVIYGPGGKSLELIKETSFFNIIATRNGVAGTPSTLTNPELILKISAEFKLKVR